MAMLSDMGINVSESDDANDEDEEKQEEADDETDNELVEVTSKAVTETKKSEPGERTDDPVRMYLREMGTVELCRARAKSPSPSASRPAARR
jgi:RNA polymerase primary sigma factor